MKNFPKYFSYSLFLLLLLNLSSCKEAMIPKPYGYFRVELPKPVYRRLDTLSFPYSFDISSLAQITTKKAIEEKYWLDISYPHLHANVYCSYLPVHNNLMELLEDSRKIVYKHTIKADGISEKIFESQDHQVFGILYDLKGNTASSLQFVLTDSTKHFFRAALYFDNVPNKDSIAPMAEYIREDMIRLVESFSWKK